MIPWKKKNSVAYKALSISKRTVFINRKRVYSKLPKENCDNDNHKQYLLRERDTGLCQNKLQGKESSLAKLTSGFAITFL